MTLTVTIDSVDVTDKVRLDSLRLTMEAIQGQVGAGSLRIDDTTGSADLAPIATEWSVTESDATPTTIAGGFVAEEDVPKGPLRAGTQRQFKPVLEDWNTVLTDRVYRGSGAKRPEETDYQRVSWLIGSSALAMLDGAGQIPNTNTETMPATDYWGKTPLDVLDDCAESAGKNFYIYHASGWKLYYDTINSTEAAFTSGIQISDDPSDIDNATVFGASDIDYTIDPGRIYSGIAVKYDGGQVWRKNTTTESTYRRLQRTVVKKSIKNAKWAKAWADRQLSKLNEPTKSLKLTVGVPGSVLGDLRAGQRIQVKLRSRGITAFTYFRIAETNIRLREGLLLGHVSDVEYEVRLSMRDKIRPVNLDDDYGGGDSSGSTIPDSLVIGDGGTATDTTEWLIDDFDRTINGPWGTTPEDLGAPWVGSNTWVCALDGVSLGVAPGEASITFGSDGPSGTMTGTMTLDTSENWGPWADGDLGYRFAWKVDAITTPPGDALFPNIIKFHNDDGSAYCGFIIHLGDAESWAHMDPDEQQGLVLMDTSSTYGTFVPMTFVADTWYTTRFDIRGSTMRLKVWASSVPEPVTWTATLAKTDTTSADTEMGFEATGEDLVTYTFAPIYATLRGSGMTPLPPGDGSTTTWTVEPWVPGSLKVWVDGILTAPTSFDREAGTFTFDRAPALGAVITVEYQPA